MIHERAALCTYVMQIVVVRQDGTIHQIDREGTSVEHDAADIRDVVVQLLIEQAAILHREVTACKPKSSGAACSHLQSLSDACDTELSGGDSEPDDFDIGGGAPSWTVEDSRLVRLPPMKES